MLQLASKTKILLCLFTLSFTAIFLYCVRFEVAYAYVSISSVSVLDFVSYGLLLLVWLGVIAALFPSEVHTPSDIFLCFYLLCATFWSACYWPATRLITSEQACLLALLLLLPAVMVAMGRWVASRLTVPNLVFPIKLTPRALVSILMFVLLLTALVGYKVVGTNASFSFAEIYVRRLAGRGDFANHILSAYLIQISVNGLAPYLAFVAMRNRMVLPYLVALVFSIACYHLLGLKQPIVNVILLGALGYFVRSNRIIHFPRLILGGLLILMLSAVLESCYFSTTFLSDYVVRRVALVSSLIQVYFLHAFCHGGSVAWFTGIDTTGYQSAEFFVGAKYMHRPLMNADTNAYLHQLASGGIIDYLAVVLGTACVTTVLDILYLRRRCIDSIAIAAMFGILLVEQAFTIVLASSGIGLCIVLAMLSQTRQST